MTAYPIRLERRKTNRRALAILRGSLRRHARASHGMDTVIRPPSAHRPGRRIKPNEARLIHALFPARLWRPGRLGMTMRKTPMRNRASLSPMNLAAPKPMTLAEFLKWEERQDLRYEFDGSAPVAMAGGSLAHAAIQRNLALALGSRLRGKPCQFFGSDLKIQAAETSSRYPDGMVICSDSIRPSRSSAIPLSSLRC